MDVAGWLRGLGLGQYEVNFRDNKIDADILPRLTGDDLKDIGVSALGDRLRLLDAIAALADAKPLASVVVSSSKSAPPKAAQVSAERRPITVMFCDLVGSTSLAAKLDAEDWRNIVNAYLDQASAAVTDLGGHVLKKLGDGLMALFGYPQAQENDAERAVRAALAIQRALAALNAGNAGRLPELAARIGLDSGPVVVDATGEVFGEAPNVAARVEGAAEPGAVVVTANVHRQIAGLFVAEDKGAHAFKGVPVPVTLYRIVRASGGRRGGARALTPLVGRGEELDLLSRRWERAVKGEGQLALIVGEPGIGKSRLVEEFRAKLAETSHTFVEWSASQLLQNTPLHPIAEWGRQRFGADLPGNQRLADLENTLSLIGLDPAEFTPLLAPLVDVPLPEERAAKLAPEELRRRQLGALVDWVLAGARSQAVALAFEDLHWADPTSLDLMARLAERGHQAPLFIVATTRPEFRPPWSFRAHHSVITLSPLDRAEVARMVDEISSRHALGKDVIDGVSDRTGGVPLFVEEVTRLLLERGVEGGAQAIPPTLQQSLAARLDRLGEAREVAQIGAVLGRSFSYGLLRAVAAAAVAAVVDRGVADRGPAGGVSDPALQRRYSGAALQSALEKLAEADILIAEGAGHEATYRFKHALIQDAAYDSLLKSRRQALHRRAAEILRDDPEHAAAEPELVAHHFTEAGLDDLAIEWWGKAGDQALRRSAFQEAIAHLGKAIAMADKAAGAKAADASGERARLQVAYGNALIQGRGHGAPETRDAFARLRENSASDKDAPERLAADYGLWVGSFVRGEISTMRAHAKAFLDDVKARPNSPEAAVAHRTVGGTHWFAGEYSAGRDHLERALALFEPGRDDELAFRFGYDAGVVAMVHLAFVLWPLGDVKRAVSLIGDAQARSAGLSHVATRVHANMHAAMFELMRSDASRAAPYANELARLTREHELPMWRAYASFLEGFARSEGGAPRGGLEEMRSGAELLREKNVVTYDGLIKIALAEAEALAGDFDRAVVILDDALAASERTGHRAFDAELHRVRGELLLKRAPADSAMAEEALRTAVAIAEQQSARSFCLRAGLALAKLYQSTARPAEAHAVLAPALEGFSPTPEMPEIAEAEALLAALAETDEVKAASTQRQRRLHLQTAYGQAMMWAKGFSAEETRAAFSRATELTAKTDNFAERFAAAHFQWTLAFLRGELRSARELESSFLKEAEDTVRVVEAGVARRGLALACYQAGDFLEARIHCERALEASELERERETQERFHDATGPIVMSVLGVTMWQLGEVERAREAINEANRRSNELGHGPSMAHPLHWSSQLEILRGDAAAALSAAEALESLSREHGMPFWRVLAELDAGWARGRLYDRAAGAAELRRALTAYAESGARGQAWFYEGLLAQLEAETLGAESALARIDEAVALARQVESRCNLAFLHLLRGDLLLKRDPSYSALAEEALQTALAIAREQDARSWGLRSALSLAKLYRSTARPADAYAVLAPALEGFSPTPEMPEIAEAQALLAALAESEEVRADKSQRQRRLRLHVAYGNALIAVRGFGAQETTEAFARARESATGDKDAPDRLAADYGLWVGSFIRGELSPMRAYAAAFLRDVEARPHSPEAGVAHRAAGITHWFAGEHREAQEHLERALALFQPGRDDDLAFRFGNDAGEAAMLYLALTLWPLGDVERAASLVRGAEARTAGLAHTGTHAHAKYHAAMFELMRGDLSRAASNAAELAALTREHELPMWRARGVFLDGLSTAESGALSGGLEIMRRCVELVREQNVMNFDGLRQDCSCRGRSPGRRRRPRRRGPRRGAGDMRAHRASRVRNGAASRPRRNAAEARSRQPAAPEEALQTAIAVAKQQGTRSFGLRAALSLAKLYQSTSRSAEAHAVLAPALESFSPSPEMPEIAEAQALLAALAETAEVKADATQRERRLRLQTAYGQAVMWSKGFAAEETSAAFARSRELAGGTENAAERFPAYYVRWVRSLARGEHRQAQRAAESFLWEAEEGGYATEAGVARRCLGASCFYQGKLLEARTHLERALADYRPDRDAQARFRFGYDTGTLATANLVTTTWLLGQVERARQLAEQAVRSATELGHVPTGAFALAFKTGLEIIRDDPAAALRSAETLLALVREHGMEFFVAVGEAYAGWARGRLDDPKAGVQVIRRVLGEHFIEANRINGPLFRGLLAELEAATRGPDAALTQIGKGMTIAEETGEHYTDPYLHRLRGEILLQPRPGESRARRRSVPNRHRHRKATKRAQLRVSRVAFPRQTLPIDRPPR